MTQRNLICIVQFAPGPLLKGLDLSEVDPVVGTAEFVFPIMFKDQPVTAESAPFAPLADLMDLAMRDVVRHLDVGYVFTDKETGESPDTTVLYPVRQTGPNTYLFPDLGLTVEGGGEDTIPDVLERALVSLIEAGVALSPPKQLQGSLGIAVPVKYHENLFQQWEDFEARDDGEFLTQDETPLPPVDLGEAREDLDTPDET
jgi:hypothetical protein